MRMRLFDVVDYLQEGYYLAMKDKKENIYGGRVCTVRYISDKLEKKGYYEIILLTGDRYYSYTTVNEYEVIALRDTEDNDLFTDLYEKHYCLDGDIVDKIKEIITSWDDYDGTGKTDMIILLRHYLGISKNVIKLITFLHNLYRGQDQFEEKTQDETEFMIETIKNVTQESDESVRFSLNNIFARIAQVRSDEIKNDKDLEDMEKVLDIVGISMRGDDGQYKEAKQIIAEIAVRWKYFKNSAKKIIAITMAGSCDFNKFIVLMDNWNK